MIGRDSATPVRLALALAFALVGALFFIWGFATSTIDTLIPSVRSIFQLSYVEAVATQFCFFIAYAVIALPAAALLARAGYARTIALALGAMLLGCGGMALASRGDSYAAVLAALFVIASGVTTLQVSANPLVAGLGAPERSHFRLTLVQAFNSMGAIAGPYLGAVVLLQGGLFAAAPRAGARAASLAKIETLFGAIGLVIAGLIVAAWIARRTIDGAAEPPDAGGRNSPFAAIRDRWALAGAGAIFLYVGSEIAILSLLINFLSQAHILGISHADAGKLLGLYGVGRMVGRFAGSAAMTRLPVAPLLMATAGAAAVLCLVPFGFAGRWVGYLTLGIGLFTSITFPAVFTLTLERSLAPRAATSGLLVMGITGGAILPLLAGAIADAATIAASFVVPLVGFTGVAIFARRAHGAAVRSDAGC